MDAQAIIDAVISVTKQWRKQRKAEERDRARRFRRKESLVRSQRVTIKEAAFEVMEQAYLKASSKGTLPAHARQIFYAARGRVQDATGKTLDDKYFCQTLLPDFLAENPETTADWDVVFDARGHFAEPHTDLIVPLGTLDVRDYLGDVESQLFKDELSISLGSSTLFPTCGPLHRFGAILFIEKEGFLPLFKAVKLAERFDIAIMSTKGMSVTASRLLVERLCSEYGIPLLVLHDFDKSGFSIVGTLQRDTRRYSFAKDIDVIDLGLRLKDVEQWQLESEDVAYGKSDPSDNLRENGATEQEIAFLCDEGSSTWNNYVGRRVELNAFASGDLVAWIEAGLTAHGVKKLVPGSETLAVAYRRAASRVLALEQIQHILRQAQADADRLTVPETLERELRARLEKDPDVPWDEAVADMAADCAKGAARGAYDAGK
jgi:hypothetical protein